MKLVELYPAAPQAVRQIVGDSTLVEIQIGRSDSRVYKTTAGDEPLYLKIQTAAAVESFAYEVDVLRWLDGKLPVPKVIAHNVDESLEYLILTEVPGINCVEAMEVLPPSRIVELLAEGLHRLHALDLTICPFDLRIERKLAAAAENVRLGRVDQEDFDPERQGMTAAEVLKELHNRRPLEDDLVFNHGDYCLPNILLKGEAISGFIDLGRAGVADRYNDLAIASRSIAYNLGEEYAAQFFEVYGIEKVDWEKIEYYRAMDELF